MLREVYFVAFCAIWLTCQAGEQATIKVHITTWNVNNQAPPDDLSILLGQNPGDRSPDVIAVGLQEVTMNPKQAVIDYLFQDKWTTKIDLVLSKEYTKVKTKVLVSVLLVVYVKNDYIKTLKDVEGFSIATGFGGLYGNKGGVVINFRLLGRRFSVVNSHLPAHDTEGAVTSRIEDINRIDQKRAKESWSAQDYLFWMGDLNFRIEDINLDAETIDRLVKEGKYKDVLAKDELKMLMAEGKVFHQWVEPEITFNPTFKLFVGKGTYNLKRRPAWTDRILYRSDTKKQITTTVYTSTEGYVESDHRPVMAQFELKL